jgi:hypothetical protein
MESMDLSSSPPKRKLKIKIICLALSLAIITTLMGQKEKIKKEGILYTLMNTTW